LILWGAWLLVTGMAISLGKGIIHEYYTVALVPAIGALVGIGAALMWKHRESWFARIVLALTLAATSIWAYQLLGRVPNWIPALQPVVLILGLGLSVAMLVPMSRRVGLAALGAAIIVAMAAPTAYAVSTVRTSHAGALPTAGPASGGARFGPGGGGPRPNFANGPPGIGTGNAGGLPNFGGAFPGGGTTAPGATANGNTGTGNAFPGGGFRGGAGRGGIGGLLNGTTVSAKVKTLLQDGKDDYRWVAAAVGANNAASYQLASGEAVMAIGGFNGSDPAPSLAQFQAYVKAGKIHYFIGGGGGGLRPGGGSTGTSTAISSWVTANFQSTTVGGATIYDFTKPVTTAK
jgi:hypothetical protein